eukprot:scaffold3402_cov169-Amphora_coffeaeformis.AAC.20
MEVSLERFFLHLWSLPSSCTTTSITTTKRTHARTYVPSDPSFTRGNPLATGDRRKVNLIGQEEQGKKEREREVEKVQRYSCLLVRALVAGCRPSVDKALLERERGKSRRHDGRRRCGRINQDGFRNCSSGLAYVMMT